MTERDNTSSSVGTFTKLHQHLDKLTADAEKAFQTPRHTYHPVHARRERFKRRMLNKKK